jgi:succinyl-diaminopimelate desuccinylase
VSSLVETLTWLVDIPSETGQEEAICQAVIDRLSGAYGPEEFTRVGNSFVVGRRTGKPLVALVGHLDTVPSQGQGAADVRDGRLYGLGAADMKSGLAVMVHLLEDPAVVHGAYDVIGVFYDAEEGPADGNGLEPTLQQIQWLSETWFAVVLEPCDRQIQVGCNGAINARVTFQGASAHSARPWWGENAVTKAGEWLAAMHRREPDLFVVDGLEFREVMSVTKAAGGIANNIIPPEFTLNLNYRFNPTRTMDEAIRHLTTVCDAADSVEIVDAAPAGPVDASHPLVKALATASGSALASKQGWTDVARLGVHGIPGVNFGPGSAKQAHQVVEYVDLDDLDMVHSALRTVLTGAPSET